MHGAIPEKSNAAGYLWWFNAVKRVQSVGFQSKPHLWPKVSVNRAGSPVAWASFRTQVLTSGVLACLLQGKMYPDLSHFLHRTRSGSLCGWLSLEIMWSSSIKCVRLNC